MSTRSLRRLLSLLAAFLALVAGSSAQRDHPFMEEFRQLMKLKSTDDMATLLRRNEVPAILAVIETCEAIGSGSNDQLEAEIDALDKAWRKAYGTRFVDKQYRYFALDLQPNYRVHRKDVLKRYNILRKDFDEAAKTKDGTRLPALGLEFNAMGDQFAELNDHYMAGVCYWVYAQCFDDELNDKAKADYKRACEAWGLFVQSREQLELRDVAYNQAKVHFEDLEFRGFGDPSKGPEARAAAKAAGDPAYQPKTIEATFELVPDIERIERPIYGGDSNFQIWAALALEKIDSSAHFEFVEHSPTVIRTGANKASVDVDGDGKGDVDIPLTGKIMPVAITLGSGDQQRGWGFLAAIGQQQDTFQGFRFNLSPDENQMLLYVGPAASMVGTLNGVRIQVLDDNLDGRYGSGPNGLFAGGLLEGSLQHDIDSIVVGEAKSARPWSRLQKIGDAWFQLESGAPGAPFTATRTDVETGFLQLDLKGVPVQWLVVRGTGNAQDLLFELVNGGANKVEVPTGSYELFTGQVGQGKKSQMMKALVLPGKNTRTWSVTAGLTTKVELGAPFTLDFAVQQDADTVSVVGPSIVVLGRGGETYQRMWNCVLAPEVNLRKEGTSRGKKEGRMVPVSSQEELETRNYDYKTVWFPVGEPIPKSVAGETFEVQLFEKKNKLFGKLESDWKAK